MFAELELRRVCKFGRQITLLSLTQQRFTQHPMDSQAEKHRSKEYALGGITPFTGAATARKYFHSMLTRVPQVPIAKWLCNYRIVAPPRLELDQGVMATSRRPQCLFNNPDGAPPPPLILTSTVLASDAIC